MKILTPPITATVSLLKPQPTLNPFPVQNLQTDATTHENSEENLDVISRGLRWLRQNVTARNQSTVTQVPTQVERHEPVAVQAIEVDDRPIPGITLPAQYRYSPHDLIRFYQHEVISWLDRWNIDDKLNGGEGRVKDEIDSGLMLFIEKGNDHEMAYLNQLIEEGKDVKVVTTPHDDESVTFEDAYQETLAAMKEGHEVIFQASLRSGSFAGYADFLIKVPNEPGVKNFIDGKEVDYHYDVWDTKLARSVKTYHILQLCAYSEMLEDIQGIRPEEVAIVLGTQEIARMKTSDYFYYYKQLKEMFLKAQQEFDPLVMPEITKGNYEHWDSFVQSLLKERDDLALIAGITRKQIKRFNNAGIYTRTELSETEREHVPGINEQTFTRLKLQATYQIKSEGKKKPEYVVLEHEPMQEYGLATLPPPSKAGLDVFFDIEGYPLAEGGLEYLLGTTTIEDGERIFTALWAENEAEEKQIFEQFIDNIYARFQEDPSMHVYHYASYEVTAIARLASKHGTREAIVDELFHHGVFIDMFKVIKRGMVVGTPSYSLKDIENLFRDKRDGDVKNAVSSIVEFDNYLDVVDPEIRERLKQNIKDYNEDDCDSTLDLYEFLYRIQQEHGINYYKSIPAKQSSPNISRRFDRSRAIENKNTPLLVDALRSRYAEDISEKSDRGQIVELVTNLLTYHSREERMVRADKLRRFAMTEEEIIKDPDCLGDCTRTEEETFKDKRSLVFTYQYDIDQETSLKPGDRVYFHHDTDIEATIHDINYVTGIVQIRMGKETAEGLSHEPREDLSLIPNSYVPPGRIHDSLYRIASQLNSDTPRIWPALRKLLYREVPNGETTTTPIIVGDVYSSEIDGEKESIRVVKGLGRSTLFIQGPPGSGKTTLAAESILALLQDGKKVGISGPSHKAINNLMKKVFEMAKASGVDIKGIKIGEFDDEMKDLGIDNTKSSSTFFNKKLDDYQLVAGTPWVFSHEDAPGVFDHLFVDESGQVPLAHAVAMVPAAKNVVFVGDPEQLPQPNKAKHPQDSGDSVFEYYLHSFPGRQTIPEHAGIFLPKTFRMSPAITSFISDNFYEGRLSSHDNTESHVVTPLGAQAPLIGIQHYMIPHEDNHRSSPEELTEINRLMSTLQTYKMTETTGPGKTETRTITRDDILVVAPYNAQVHTGLRLLGEETRVGTVDKFQGQEAQVVLVSLASSSPRSARGLEFILNPNRLNVALSRAKAYAGIFFSPTLLEMRPKTLKEWRLINLLCKIVHKDRFLSANSQASQNQEPVEQPHL